MNDRFKFKDATVIDQVPIDFKTIADFCREYVPLAYVIEPILRAAALYTLTGRTGHGKTALLVIAALAIATGRPDILGREVTRGRVVLDLRKSRRRAHAVHDRSLFAQYRS